MDTSTEDEKGTLNVHGKVIDYSKLQKNEVEEKSIKGLKYNLMYLIKESDLKNFTNYIQNEDGNIIPPGPIQHRTSELNFKKKCRKYLEVELCMEGKHFVPDLILRDDILFCFKRNKGNDFFIVVKDAYIKQVLESEHCIIGMIDFCKGKDLFLQKNNIIKSKMKIFQIEINKLSLKYKGISFITISDSIIIKYSFQIISKEGKFLPDRLNFNRIIELFKEIRKITKRIFTMDVYGIFIYDMNKCKPIQSNSSNVFHAGILSHGFKKVFEIEEICRRLKKNKKGDLYMTSNLYYAFRHHVQKQLELSPIEQMKARWKVNKKDIEVIKEIRGVTEEDIIVSKIPDEPITY